jgi:hypothetical protein
MLSLQINRNIPYIGVLIGNVHEETGIYLQINDGAVRLSSFPREH